MPSIHRSTKAPTRYRLDELGDGLSIRFDCIIFLRSALLFSPCRPGSTLSWPNGGNAPAVGRRHAELSAGMKLRFWSAGTRLLPMGPALQVAGYCSGGGN